MTVPRAALLTAEGIPRLWSIAELGANFNTTSLAFTDALTLTLEAAGTYIVEITGGYGSAADSCRIALNGPALTTLRAMAFKTAANPVEVTAYDTNLIIQAGDNHTFHIVAMIRVSAVATPLALRLASNGGANVQIVQGTVLMARRIS